MSDYSVNSISQEPVSEVVVKVFHKMNEPRGASLKTLTNLISDEYDNLRQKDIRKPLADALRRGCIFGIIKKRGYLYKLGCDINQLSNQFLKNKSPIRQSDSLIRRSGKKVTFDQPTSYGGMKMKTTKRLRQKREQTPYYPYH